MLCVPHGIVYQHRQHRDLLSVSSATVGQTFQEGVHLRIPIFPGTNLNQGDLSVGAWDMHALGNQRCVGSKSPLHPSFSVLPVPILVGSPDKEYGLQTNDILLKRLTVSLSSVSQRCEYLSLFSFCTDLTFHLHFFIFASSSVSGSSGKGTWQQKFKHHFKP